jgi:ABC-type transport system substrate-binding protein
MNSRAGVGRLLSAVLAAALTASACGAAGAADTAALAPTVRLAVTSPDQAATSDPPGSTSSSTPQDTSPVAAADPDDAVEELAVAWLVAYRTVSYTGQADAWIDRTAPYVTEELRQQNLQLRDGGREAPRTDDTVHVQAAGTLHTSCTTGTDPPNEALAVTLTAVRTDAGWRIASREY